MNESIRNLTAETTAALDAAELGKYGRSVHRDLKAGDHAIRLTLSDEYVRVNRYSQHRKLRRKQQFKSVNVDNKGRERTAVISMAKAAELTGGRVAQIENQALRAEFESRAPQLALDFSKFWTDLYSRKLVHDLGVSTELMSSYKREDAGAKAVLQQLAQFSDFKRVDGKGYLVLNAEKLQDAAVKYGEVTALDWYFKTASKLGAVTDPTILSRPADPNVVVEAKLGRHAVRLEQNVVWNVSPLGTPFHQFPARIYVDSKFYPEAVYFRTFPEAAIK